MRVPLRAVPQHQGRDPQALSGLLFKGSGFHITDYRSKSYKEKAKQEKGSPAPAGEKKKSPPAE